MSQKPLQIFFLNAHPLLGMVQNTYTRQSKSITGTKTTDQNTVIDSSPELHKNGEDFLNDDILDVSPLPLTYK